MIDTADDETYQTLLQQYDNILCFDDDATPHLKIIDSDIPKLLSPESIVKISDQIFYINDDFLKIVNYDNFDFNTLVNCTKNSDKITVIKIKDKQKLRKRKPFIIISINYIVEKFYRNYWFMGAKLCGKPDWFTTLIGKTIIKTRIGLQGQKQTLTRPRVPLGPSFFPMDIGSREGAPNGYIYSEGSGSKSKTKKS